MLVAHLSDPHIAAGGLASESLSGLHRALGRLLALDPPPDCVVITGDLIEHGHPAGYAVLGEMIGRFPLPLHLVAGNHDDRDAMLDAFGGTEFLGNGTQTRYTVDYPGATVVVLDSSAVDDPRAGRLGGDQLVWLDEALASRPQVPAFVCLHHPPIPVGIPFLDSIRLLDGDALAEVIAGHRQVVRVLAGHVHRAVTAAFAGSVLAIAPSTYRQTELCMRAEATIGDLVEPTSFLLHVLTATGGCVTHTVPVSHAGALLRRF